MDSIVLRDRNGKEINYHGIDYLDVKTPDGETQGYAAYDPETLVPENLVSGVKVGDVEGALEVPQAVETTIDPDFSAGNMEVVPADGQVFSKVSIPKPANLTPANIAKDVDIAGVVGTLEGGGSAVEPYIEYTLNENGETVTAKMYGFTTIPAGCFAYSRHLESIDFTESPGITSIEEQAFRDCNALTSITIPESVTSIGDFAFYGCPLTSITIPEGVTSIGTYAFYGCTALTSITIPEGVTSIGQNTFFGCTALTSITIPESVTRIGQNAFYGCTALTSITIPEGVTSIAFYAFYQTPLTYAKFESTRTWTVKSTATATSGLTITVTNTSTAATYLKSKYVDRFWFRD